MKKPPPADNFFFAVFFSLAAFFSLPLCSCSDDAVDAASAQANLILDWEDEQSLPTERLSVFVEISSNVRRLESFSVKSGPYTWNVDSPIVFMAGENQWAGWPRLEPPLVDAKERPLFPLGNYQIECVDAAGKKDTASFSITFNAALLDATVDKVEGLLPAPQKRIAVYSESNELLYFDSPKSSWLNDESIFKDVKDSSYYRNTIANGNALCFFPKKFKEAKEGEKPDAVE